MPRHRQAEPEEAGTGGGSGIRSIIQGILIFAAAQFLLRQFLGGGGSSKSKSSIPSFDQRPQASERDPSFSKVPQSVAPIWPSSAPIDIAIYISPSLVIPNLRSGPRGNLVVDEKDFRIDDWKDRRQIDTSFTVPKEVQNNGTLWAHVFVALSGSALDPTESSYDQSKAYHFVRPLTQYVPKKKAIKTKKLLGSSNETTDGSDDVGSKGPVVASFYHPNCTISVIPDSGNIAYPNMHPAMRQYVNLETSRARDASGKNGWYYPILFVNTFWQLREHMTELNSTVETLPLHLELNHLSNWKFGIYASLDESMRQNRRQIASGGSMPAAGDGSELEEFKRILVDTNVYLLATTGVVSVLHMIFEMLAFKNDISHWKNKKDNVGVSVRTILANVFMQTVIFLYLVDNSEGTSWMILFGQGLGIVLEAWKITKTVDVRVRPAPAGSFLPYRITFEDKHKLSETEKKTKEYDEIAFKYLYVVAVPLLLAYAAYSLVYETHKSWYSFIIAALVGSVYAYGFLMMVPSLYINYRLGSVAHMPARAMTYKFLNTFIDDLFAWTIKMPTLHRLATLRDDVIFFIYLYQSYKYKTDYTRINEFGQGGDDSDDDQSSPKAVTSGDKSSVASESRLDDKGAGAANKQTVAATGRESGTGKNVRKR